MLSLPRDLWVPIAGGAAGANASTPPTPRASKPWSTRSSRTSASRSTTTSRSTSAGSKSWCTPSAACPCGSTGRYRDRNSGLQVDHPGCVTLDGFSALAFARARNLEYMQDGVWQSDGTGDLGRICAPAGLHPSGDRSRCLEGSRRSAQVEEPRRGRHEQRQHRQGSDDQRPARPRQAVSEVQLLDTQDADPAGHRVSHVGWRRRAAPRRVRRPTTAQRVPRAGAERDRRAGDQRHRPEQLRPHRRGGRTWPAPSRRPGSASLGGATAPSSVTPARTGPSSGTSPKSEVAADLLARHLSVRAQVKEDRSLAAGQVVLFVGKDFTTVLANARAPGSASTTTEPGKGDARTTTTRRPATTSTTARAASRSLSPRRSLARFQATRPR